MKNNKFSLLFLLIISCLYLFGCTKNDVGEVDFEQFPSTWTLYEYLENGTDKSSEIRLQNLTHKFIEGGFYGFSYWYTDALGQTDSLKLFRINEYFLYVLIKSLFYPRITDKS